MNRCGDRRRRISQNIVPKQMPSPVVIWVIVSTPHGSPNRQPYAPPARAATAQPAQLRLAAKMATGKITVRARPSAKGEKIRQMTMKLKKVFIGPSVVFRKGSKANPRRVAGRTSKRPAAMIGLVSRQDSVRHIGQLLTPPPRPPSVPQSAGWVGLRPPAPIARPCRSCRSPDRASDHCPPPGFAART